MNGFFYAQTFIYNSLLNEKGDNANLALSPFEMFFF